MFAGMSNADEMIESIEEDVIANGADRSVTIGGQTHTFQPIDSTVAALERLDRRKASAAGKQVIYVQQNPYI